MSDLTEEEDEILQRMLEEDKWREQIPPSQRVPISNPEKYSFSVGIDAKGRPFEVESDGTAEGEA